MTSILTKIIINKKNQKFFSVLDIGSNIGDKSLSLAKNLLNKKIKNFLIYSIESTEFAINKQIENLNLNKELKKKIKIFPLFLLMQKIISKKLFLVGIYLKIII